MARKQFKEIESSVNFQLWQSLEALSNRLLFQEGQAVCLAQQPDGTYLLVLKGTLLVKIANTELNLSE